MLFVLLYRACLEDRLAALDELLVNGDPLSQAWLRRLIPEK